MDRQKRSLRTTGSAGKGEGGAPAGLLDGALEACWLLTAVLAPLWINLWSSQPFEPAKAALVRSLVWLMAGLWLARRLLSGKASRRRGRRVPLLWTAGALAAVLVAATVTAADPALSLFGSHTRGQGLLTLLSYLLLFLVVAPSLRTMEQAQRLMTTMVITAVPLIALGGAQAAGVDPLGLVTDARSPVYATLGRPNFLGAYLALLLPPTLALLLLARSRRRRAALAALLVAEGALILLTATRAPLLAAGGGLLAFTIFWLWPRWSLRQRLVAGGGALLAGLGAALGVGSYVQQATAGSVAARRAIWGAVWDLIRQRPLLGYGPDSLEIVFPRVYPPELVYYQGRELFVDRAHNLLLDWTAAAGVLGAAAFAAFVATFFVIGVRRLGRTGDDDIRRARAGRRGLLAACLAAVAANLAGNLVSFDVTATAVAGWLFIAVVVSPALAAEQEGAAAGDGPAGAAPASWPRVAAAGALLAATLMAVVHFNGRPLLADVAHRQATLAAGRGDWQAAVHFAQKAANRWPAEPAHHRLLSRAHLGRAHLGRAAYLERAASSGRFDRDGLERAEAALLGARDRRPQDVAGWTALGRFYHQVGVSFDAGALPLAHDAYRQAMALAPHYARLHVAWAELYLDENRPDPAAHHLQRAVALDATDGLAYRLLGDVALARGDPVAALDNYRQAARWSPDAALAHLGLARAYGALDRPAEAHSALERAAELDAGHPAIRQAQEQMAP